MLTFWKILKVCYYHFVLPIMGAFYTKKIVFLARKPNKMLQLFYSFNWKKGRAILPIEQLLFPNVFFPPCLRHYITQDTACSLFLFILRTCMESRLNYLTQKSFYLIPSVEKIPSFLNLLPMVNINNKSLKFMKDIIYLNLICIAKFIFMLFYYLIKITLGS